MNDTPNTQIIIRHIAGAKINRIDPFALSSTSEITFGREAGSTVLYDSPKDDVVSRRHAVLRVKAGDVPSFVIEDLKSSNGTFVNGERISGEKELLPEDTVEFGRNGPKFAFDVQPRPANMQARTRVMTAADTATTTRAVSTAAVTAVMDTAATAAPPPPPKGVGKNTVMFMLSEERKKTSQVWMAALAAVVAFFIVGGGILYWNSLRIQQDTQEQARVQAEKVRAEASSATQQITQQMGMSAGDVVNKYGNSTVWISMSWRLFDKETGRPVFHKSFAANVGKIRRSLPAYLKIGDRVYPWFTTEDEEHKNYEIKQTGTGSGFVVSDNGFILTNKHVAAGWMVSTGPDEYLGRYSVQEAFLITPSGDGKRPKIEIVTLGSLPSYIHTWIPSEEGAVLFKSNAEILTSSLGGRDVATPSNTSSVFGKNEVLEVRFPGSALSINASNVRQSTFADAALIKIESPQALVPLETAADNNVKVGERVIVLGYPGISTQTVMEMTTTERGQVKSRVEVIPEPTVTDGIVSKLGTELTQAGTATVRGSLGDAFQLSINSTGSGNSGGPVFNAQGKVVGLFTYGRSRGGTAVTYAVPIRHGRDLLTPQRTQ
jgi:S1-C subfamily serine protease/pSer/pThr/pTyr-binding forkhead associated (FHA) protein